MTDETAPLGFVQREGAPRGAFAAFRLSFRLSAI
jgi:hypothetical protein